MIKKGEITLEELIKLILAVAGIAVLLLLAFNLYKMFSVKTEAEQAKIHLERIEKSLKKMNEGQTIEYLLTGPKGWYLVYYDEEFIKKGEGNFSSVFSCNNENCICFCNMEQMTPLKDSQKKVSNRAITYNTLVPSLISETYEWEYTRREFFENFFYNSSYRNHPIGYEKCQAESVCLKIKGIKISSYEDEAEFFVPWIGLNNSATTISINKIGESYNISRAK